MQARDFIRGLSDARKVILHDCGRVLCRPAGIDRAGGVAYG